ncbi:MAG: phosphatidylserine decarboxylase [Campylobacterota bacterium]|nr:phosphatidylserine decarboxylase [Campylobacterota bacterium]
MKMRMSKVMKSNLLPISSVGFKYIGYTTLAFVLLSVLDLEFLAFVSFLLLLALVFVYRNPERELLSFEPNSVISPVDGKVISIEENIEDSQYAYKIEIESNYLETSVLRAPLDATLESLKLKRGTRLSKNSALSKEINENAELILVDSNSNRVKIRHQLERSFDTLHIDIAASNTLRQSSRYGVMLNGITTIHLPQNFRVDLRVGSHLKASQTLIGYFS